MSCSIWFGTALAVVLQTNLAAQDPVKETIGTFGVKWGAEITVEGDYDPSAPIKSLYTFRVIKVNGGSRKSE